MNGVNEVIIKGEYITHGTTIRAEVFVNTSLCYLPNVTLHRTPYCQRFGLDLLLRVWRGYRQTRKCCFDSRFGSSNGYSVRSSAGRYPQVTVTHFQFCVTDVTYAIGFSLESIPYARVMF